MLKYDGQKFQYYNSISCVWHLSGLLTSCDEAYTVKPSNCSFLQWIKYFHYSSPSLVLYNIVPLIILVLHSLVTESGILYRGHWAVGNPKLFVPWKSFHHLFDVKPDCMCDLFWLASQTDSYVWGRCVGDAECWTHGKNSHWFMQRNCQLDCICSKGSCTGGVKAQSYWTVLVSSSPTSVLMLSHWNAL